ncbi:MAG TPA: hypothetical protein VJ044_13150 [Candidatus Hodarchaeales archaeon]|nr:hypothetical protein [Candidatus Hodarchaeales archaeon]
MYILIRQPYAGSRNFDKILGRLSEFIVDSTLEKASQFGIATAVLVGERQSMIDDAKSIIDESVDDLFSAAGMECDEYGLIQEGLGNMPSYKFDKRRLVKIIQPFIDDEIAELRQQMEHDFQFRVNAEVQAGLRRMSKD